MEKNNNDLIDFLAECLLNILKKSDDKVKALESKGLLDEANNIKNTILDKYEKIYLALTDKDAKNSYKDSDLNNLSDSIKKIMYFYSISEDHIHELMALRTKYQAASGSEIVKNIFTLEKDNLIKAKNRLLKKAGEILDKEEKIHLLISNSIQEADQLKYAEKLQPLWQEYRKLETEINAIQEKLISVENKLEKKWYYEIYGTISKEDMKNVFINSIRKK